MNDYYNSGKQLVKNGPVASQENAVRTNLKKGKKYIIVPSPRNSGDVGKFHLSIYMSCELSDVNVERVGTLERYVFIKEEYEKAQRGMLPWKVKWVKQQAKAGNFIVKDDKGTNLKSSFAKSLLNKSGISGSRSVTPQMK